MWAKQFSVNPKWLKKVLIYSFSFGAFVVAILLGLKWDVILHPEIAKPKEKIQIVKNLTSSSTVGEQDIQALANVINLLENKNINTNKVFVDEYRDVYLDTDFSKFIFSLKTDNKKLVNTLLSVLDNKIFKTSPSGSENMLEYIDIRFGNKVFYKYATELQVLATSTRESDN